jgi:hypothetical protein
MHVHAPLRTALLALGKRCALAMQQTPAAIDTTIR